ncbi:MAG: HEAT repeat domain-containing protein [Elusimicrobiota bacterium]
MRTLLLLAALSMAVFARAAAPENPAIDRLQSDDAAVRERACVELASTTARGPHVYAALALAMDRDLSDRVRLAAAKAVLTFPGDDAIKRAQAFLQSEPGSENRIALTAALSVEPAHLQDGSVTDFISGRLTDDPSPEVRRTIPADLARRGDPEGLPAVRRAAQNDPDKLVREAAGRAIRILSAPRPAPPKPKVWKPQPPKADAVKGKDPCPAPWAWCACDGPIKRAPKCMTHAECRVSVDTLIQLGMPCTWSGLPIGIPE